MNSSSTQVPFMIAALIVVVIHSLTSEPTIDNKVKATNKVESATTVVMLNADNNKDNKKLAAR